jgi:hypothetical protein
MLKPIRKIKLMGSLQNDGKETFDLFGYLDYIAMPYNLYECLVNYDTSGTPHIGKKCTPNYIASTCTEGHVFYRPIYCGREYCPFCGAPESPTHRRRYSRAWDRIINQIGDLGYLVVTIPKQAGELYYDAKFLKSVRKYWTRKLQRESIASRGLNKWHWQGDIGPRWFPHLNFLFEGNWIAKTVLIRLRHEYTLWLKKKWNIKGFDSADIFYEYKKTDAEKVHVLKYVMRPTWHHYTPLRDEVFSSIRGTTWFGDWPKVEKKESADAEVEMESSKLLLEQKYLDLLNMGLCPICLSQVKHKFKKPRDVPLDACIEVIEKQLWVMQWSSE